MLCSLLSLSALLLSYSTVVYARPPYSLPEDPFAFPKHRVTFLNGLPVLNETAERWLRDGLHGGELEFLEKPWHEDHWDHRATPMKEIGSGDTSPTDAPVASTSYSLERMRMGPRNSYLCLIPPPVKHQSVPPEEPPAEATAMHSWSLLQPLAGSCIYHRQGWFTYAYCHNSHVRQFREMVHPHPIDPRTYAIEEDPDWEAYDLGRAPSTEHDADLTVADQAANLELARNAGSRYLVQRWGDGTVCDKTGKRREIEVQFHCSMTMTDTILFVKETKTCYYVLVVNTPRLCGEPGFKSHLDQREEALIRCREVLDAAALAAADHALPDGDHPFRLPAHTQSHAPPPIDGADGTAGDNKGDADTNAKDTIMGDAAAAIRRTLEALLQGGNLFGNEAPRVVMDDGELMIEFVSDIEQEGDEEDDGEEKEEGILDSNAITEALRAAGYEVRGERRKTRGKDVTAAETAPDAPTPGPPVARGRPPQRGGDEL